jgi:hypothetical protein
MVVSFFVVLIVKSLENKHELIIVTIIKSVECVLELL